MDLWIKNYSKMWKMTTFLTHFRFDWLTLMPADALNLINHIKLHVNGKIEKRQKEEDR